MSVFQPITHGSNSINNWSLSFICAAGEGLLVLDAIVIAHTLTLVTAILDGQETKGLLTSDNGLKAGGKLDQETAEVLSTQHGERWSHTAAL